MTTPSDIAVIGAGPAGAHAALAVARQGLNVVMIDEQPQAGGQVWRAHSRAILKAPASSESTQGAKLRDMLAASSVVTRYDTRVWQIERKSNSWTIGIVDNEAASTVSAHGLILATGAHERVSPVPGWTLPGVVGLAGATAMFKRDLVLPGKRTVVAGCGPLLFYVAAELLRLGGSVAAIVSLNTRADWLRALPGMATRPDLLGRGLTWMAQIRRAGVPVLWGHAVTAIDGTDAVRSVTAVPVDSDWSPKASGATRAFDADSVCLGHGLSPSTEASRLAGAAHVYLPELGGWIPQVDDVGATSVPMLWACGDGAGILGVGAAPLRGALAGLAAARALSALSSIEEEAARRNLASELKRASRFGEAMTGLTIPRRGLLDLITPETSVCRCESVRRAEIDGEAASGAKSPNTIKAGTRAGMGACGGRYCTETVAQLTAAATGRPRDEIGLPTVRPPLRPVLLGTVVGDFEYDSLPVPGAAPL
jgi:thioredoxin reductase